MKNKNIEISFKKGKPQVKGLPKKSSLVCIAKGTGDKFYLVYRSKARIYNDFNLYIGPKEDLQEASVVYSGICIDKLVVLEYILEEERVQLYFPPGKEAQIIKSSKKYPLEILLEKRIKGVV